MKKRNKYRQVDKLPTNSLTISDYARSKGYETNAYIYHEWKRHVEDEKEIGFEIVSFHGINFVIPKKIKA